MASRGRGGGRGGGRIGGGGRRDDGVYRPVAETPAERGRASSAPTRRGSAPCGSGRASARGRRPSCPLRGVCHGEASSLRRRSRSPTPPPAFDDDEDDADSGRVIGPEDFVKRPAEEELALAEALAKTATEEAERRAALRAVEVFQEREAARAQRLADRVAEAAHVLLPPPPLLGSRLRQSRSPAPPAIGGVDRPR
jgi:hypothetical protein